MEITNNLIRDTRPDPRQWVEVYGLFHRPENKKHGIPEGTFGVGKNGRDVHFTAHFTARDGRIEVILTPENYLNLRTSRWMTAA